MIQNQFGLYVSVYLARRTLRFQAIYPVIKELIILRMKAHVR
jgi:hypothetical protein